MKLRLFLLPIIAVVLAACGGSSVNPLGGSSSVDTHGNEVINGIVVPPDPGAAKDATLAGVDVDRNGIRDEMDRWIATKYGENTGALEPIRMGVKVAQKLLVSNPSTQDQALAIAYESMDTGKCIWRELDRQGVPSSQFFSEIMIRTYDTRDRIEARKKVFSVAGMIARSTKEMSISCPFKR